MYNVRWPRATLTRQWRERSADRGRGIRRQESSASKDALKQSSRGEPANENKPQKKRGSLGVGFGGALFDLRCCARFRPHFDVVAIKTGAQHTRRATMSRCPFAPDVTNRLQGARAGVDCVVVTRHACLGLIFAVGPHHQRVYRKPQA